VLELIVVVLITAPSSSASYIWQAVVMGFKFLSLSAVRMAYSSLEFKSNPSRLHIRCVIWQPFRNMKLGARVRDDLQ